MATYSLNISHYVAIIQGIYIILLSEFIDLSTLNDVTKLTAQITALIWAVVGLIKTLKNKDK